jgi:hypothetical protein
MIFFFLFKNHKLYGWVGGKQACVDLIGFFHLRDWGLGLLQWDRQPSKPRQVAKHEKPCFGNQHVFIPFVFDTFGFLTMGHA